MAAVFLPPVVALTAGFPLKSTVPSSVYTDGVVFSVSLNAGLSWRIPLADALNIVREVSETICYM